MVVLMLAALLVSAGVCAVAQGETTISVRKVVPNGIPQGVRKGMTKEQVMSLLRSQAGPNRHFLLQGHWIRLDYCPKSEASGRYNLANPFVTDLFSMLDIQSDGRKLEITPGATGTIDIDSYMPSDVKLGRHSKFCMVQYEGVGPTGGLGLDTLILGFSDNRVVFFEY